MIASDLIDKILSSSSVTEIFRDPLQWKETYRQIARVIHPDVCADSRSVPAFEKINQYKDDFFEKGIRYVDDLSVVTCFYNHAIIEGPADWLKKSFDAYTFLRGHYDEAAKNFIRYLPVSYELAGAKITARFHAYSRPLCELPHLEQVHVNWLLSRLLELSGWFNQIGFIHMGINPKSVFLMPGSHGIQLLTFYHSTKLYQPVRSLPAEFGHFYPYHLFESKVATLDIDPELAKRTSIYALGDHSGIGTVLRKTAHEGFIDFCQMPAESAFQAYKIYRDWLKKEFKPVFHQLNI